VVALGKRAEKPARDVENIGEIAVANMPVSFLFIVGVIVFVFLIVLGSIFAKKPGQAGEEETLKIIKNFIQQKS